MAAPLAPPDEDWQDFNEFNESDPSLSWSASSEDPPELRGFKSFDETLRASFPPSGGASTSVSVRAVSERALLREDDIWNALTENYSNVMPVDWMRSHTRTLHLPTLNLPLQEQVEISHLDVSDDEDLRDQMDMHTIIISCVNNEPLFTAEQVLEEIEEIMHQSSDSDHEYQLNTLTHSTSNSSYEERLRGLCVSDLQERLEGVEREIRRFSEELIGQLAVREELDFEKEVKNSFISALIDVQNRQKEHRELLKKRRKMKPTGGVQRSERSHVPGTYLTTVIPYDSTAGAPAVDDLQILSKILHAMSEDSERVPALLTDYILKVLCPS